MIGQWIKESRKAKGLSQEKLAEIMYTSKQNIRHYESGNRENPTLNTLRDFSRVLDLNLLIEKGEVIKMNKETGVVQTIDEFRNRLEQQFKYTNQITIEELVGQVMSLAEEEFEGETTIYIPQSGDYELYIYTESGTVMAGEFVVE